MRETLMMGLRLTHQGISGESFKNRFGVELREVFGKQIARLVRNRLLEWTGEDHEIVRLTRRGRLLGNQVFVEFI
jgi:oxygen-independent coproporphyrinogen-3 oxidase